MNGRDPRVVEQLGVTWNETLGGFENATIFHTREWANLLDATYGYRPCYLVTGSTESPSAILPLMDVRSPITGRRGVSLPFTDMCEQLATPDAPQPDPAPALQELARQRRWRYIETRGANPFHRKASTRRLIGHRLDLSAGPEKLFADCKSSVRRAIRKAERNGVSVEFETSLTAVRQFYRLNCLTRRAHGLPPQPYAFFRNLQRALLDRGLGRIGLARKDGRTVAAAVFLHFQGAALYKYGASDSAALDLRGNNLVMWEAIRRFADEGFRRFLMGRTEPDNTGLLQFKQSFGAEPYDIEYARLTLDPRRGASANTPPLRGRHNRIFQALPIPCARIVGKMLYRHVA